MWLCPGRELCEACVHTHSRVQSNQACRVTSPPSSRTATLVGMEREASQAEKDRAALPSKGNVQASPCDLGKKGLNQLCGRGLGTATK